MGRVFPYSRRMGRKPATDERKEPASATAKVLAENLASLMAAHTDLGSNPKLGTKAKLGTGTIARLRTAEVNANLETLEALASAFDVQPWELLVPGLDPKNRPTLKQISEREHQLYERWKQVAKEFVKEDQ
jgi:transcriptional regulator with XRE-family HTH domain